MISAMKFHRFFKLAAAVGLTLSISAHADSDTENLLIYLKSEYPRINFTGVEHSSMPGIYEITMDKQLAYTDKSGQIFIYGSLYDMHSKEDLTAARREMLLRVDTKKLQRENAFKHVFGTGKEVLYMFSDPDCPYCRRMQAQLEKLRDVTLYVFLFPLASIHSDAVRKSESIWCKSGDDEKWALWRSITVDDAQVPTATCINPLAKNASAAETLGVRGTPTLISSDGRMLPGFATSERIQTWLSLANAKQ